MTTRLHLAGNVIPDSWLQRILFPKSQKPYWLAAWILSDVCYWYSPSEVKDEKTGALIGYAKKYAGEYLQRSYDDIAKRTGTDKKQAQRACKLLADMGVIKIHYLTINMGGIVLSNVVHLEPVIEKIHDLTYAETWPTMDISVYPYGHQCPYPPPPVSIGMDISGETYTVTTTGITTEREIPAPAKEQTPPAQQEPSLSLPPSGQPKQAVMDSDPFTAVSPSTAKLVGQPKHLTGFTSTWDNAPEQQEARALAKIYTGRPEDYLPIAEYLVTLQDCDLGRSELAQLNNTLAAHCVAVSNSKRLEYAVELHKMGATPEQVDSTIKFGAPLRGRTRELHSKAVPSMMQGLLQQTQTPAMSQAAVVYDQFVAPLKELHHSDLTKAYWNLPENAREIIQAVLGRLNSTYLAAAVGLERYRFIQLAAC